MGRSMNRRASVATIAAAVAGLSSAQAGPCSPAIAQFEQAVRQSAGNPNAGPVAPQSLDARGDRAGCTAALARAEDMYNLH